MISFLNPIIDLEVYTLQYEIHNFELVIWVCETLDCKHGNTSL